VEVENRFDGVDDYAIRLIKFKARQLVGKAGYTESDRPDLEQEMMLDLLRRLPKYDPARAMRTTFIATVVEHCVARLIESRRAEMRDHRREAGSLDERIEGKHGTSVAVGQTIDQESYWRRRHGLVRSQADRTDLGVDLEAALAELPPELREVCEELAVWRIFEVAKRTGISRPAVYDAIKKLRARLEDAGLKDYL
jgi:RNA polymerase sigma-70 factor (ECF subfamily)